MSSIVIRDLPKAESQLTDLSNVYVNKIIGGDTYLIVVEDHGDHYHIYVYRIE